MKCPRCGAEAHSGLTTSVTDLGECLIIIRNVPCHKCCECDEEIYTADVVQKLERLIDSAKNLMLEISVIDYSQVA